MIACTPATLCQSGWSATSASTVAVTAGHGFGEQRAHPGHRVGGDTGGEFGCGAARDGVELLAVKQLLLCGAGDVLAYQVVAALLRRAW